ncbi:hypothetical protein QQF64_001401 [Cirrhinus molitorella]|uniref:Ig-like domain-containing protein n=1 Tax=Cirrhinus molitorella TaxID=172907 RepID=A0ABR3NZZ3_9TELE
MRVSVCIKTLTSVIVSVTLTITEMERPRLALIAFTFLLFHQKKIYGEEVEMKVRPGDNITLYCDRSLTLGSYIVWIRNCSHENQPSLIIDYEKLTKKIFPRFSFIQNSYSNSFDLHITNISVSDLGLYYCAKLDNNITKDSKGIVYSLKVYYYGNQITRLSLKATSSTPPDCVLCWTLLFSVCPVCVLLSSVMSSLCVYCYCLAQTADVLLFRQTRIYGEEVETKVRPGDNITLYCDRSLTFGSVIEWIRNCSHENQPSLIINFRKLNEEIFQRFSFTHNPYNNSYDLHIINISVSDLGLYYCAEVENKVNQDEKGILSRSEVYYYGSRTTRLSLEVTSCSEPLNTTSTPPCVSDCVLCWTLLFSVCPVCVLLSSLLSSICVYCYCLAQTAGSAEILTADVIKRDPMEKHQCEMSKTGKICHHTEVSYRLLTSAHPYAKM